MTHVLHGGMLERCLDTLIRRELLPGTVREHGHLGLARTGANVDRGKLTSLNSRDHLIDLT